MGDEQPANQNHRSVLSCFAGAADVLAEHCRHWEANPAPFAMGRGGFGPQKARSWGASPHKVGTCHHAWSQRQHAVPWREHNCAEEPAGSRFKACE